MQYTSQRDYQKPNKQVQNTILIRKSNWELHPPVQASENYMQKYEIIFESVTKGDI